jgi:hypothetical protein
VIKIKDKIIRVSYETWNRLRTYAYCNESKIKKVVEDIINGKVDPITGKPI